MPGGRADLGSGRIDPSQEVLGPLSANRSRRCRCRNLRPRRTRLSGTFTSGGQEQFYLESQAAIAYPGEQGQMVVHSSTQNPTEIQALVAEMLGVGQHEVVCICKRMGGAFGGKESQAAIPAMMAALVAHKTGRSARVIYNKDDDMRVTGKRHAYLSEWEVGFDDDGRIQALRVAYYSNGGVSTDLSLAVMERTLLHTDNCYFLPHVELTGQVCFTNLPSNTAFRGFGGPQGMAVIENILESIAEHIGPRRVRRSDPQSVRRRRAQYDAVRPGVRPQPSAGNLRDACRSIAVSQTARGSDSFQCVIANAVRGLAMTGVKFGISFTTKFPQPGQRAGQHLHGRHGASFDRRHRDGPRRQREDSAARGRRVRDRREPRRGDADQHREEYQHVADGGVGRHRSNGAAAVEACRIIKRRLRRFAASRLADAKMGLSASASHVQFRDGHVHDSRRPERKIAFGELCAEARRNRVDLGSRGFYATPGVDFNRETGQGTPFFYYTQGAAVAEVLVDRFTGELRVPRVDLLMDIGRSINPGIDRGQVIGGFIQGMGWVTTEALVYDAKGDLLSHSPTTYKIPAITDVPEVFNVATFDNNDNVRNVYRSKAVGEPPLMLAIAVWAAAEECAGVRWRRVPRPNCACRQRAKKCCDV